MGDTVPNWHTIPVVKVIQVTLYLGGVLRNAGVEQLLPGGVERGDTGGVGADARLNVLHTTETPQALKAKLQNQSNE